MEAPPSNRGSLVAAAFAPPSDDGSLTIFFMVEWASCRSDAMKSEFSSWCLLLYERLLEPLPALAMLRLKILDRDYL